MGGELSWYCVMALILLSVAVNHVLLNGMCDQTGIHRIITKVIFMIFLECLSV